VRKRDDDHAMEHFAAARDMLRFESDRLSSVFSAFLLANTVLMGFLLHAATTSGGFPGEPGTAVAGGFIGLGVSGLWFAAYERNASALEMRMARARETEPDEWELLTGRPQSFDQGEAVMFGGQNEPMRVKGLARIGIRNSGRLLIALFSVVYATVAVWGIVDAVK
jgi:Zn-dependent protease with chaperone function